MDSKMVGARIVKLRKEKGYTQTILAERLNVSNKTVSRWETGDGFPEISLLPKLATELGISLDCLLSETAVDEDTGNTRLTAKIECSAVMRLFLIIASYKIITLICILSRTVLSKSNYFNTESLLNSVGVIQTIAWVLLIAMCFRLYLRQKTQKSDKASLLIAIWIAAFFIIGIYRVLMQLVFIGTLDLELNNVLLQINLTTTMLFWTTKIINYIAICTCAFVSHKVLRGKKIKRATITLITVSILSLLAQIVAIYLGKSYGIASDISILSFAYAAYIYFTLWRENNEKKL